MRQGLTFDLAILPSFPRIFVYFTLVKMSTDLQWLLIRKYNSFQVKANGVVFSREAVRIFQGGLERAVVGLGRLVRSQL